MITFSRPGRRDAVGAHVARQALLACSVLLLSRASLSAQTPRAAGRFTHIPDGIVLRLPRGLLRVTFPARDIVRVTVAPTDSFSHRPSLVVLPSRARVAVTVSEGRDTLVMRSGAATVRVARTTGALTVGNSTGRMLLHAVGPAADAFTPYADLDGPAWSIRQRFALTPDEGIFGLGQYQDGVMNYRGEEVIMDQANTNAAIPFMLSSRGYGVLWDNYSRTRFTDRNGETSLQSEVADQIDYYVIAGRRPDQAIAGYRRLTGKAPLFGKWAYGYWQSKERYVSQQEVLDVAREYRRRQLPIDNIVQDWSYWGPMEQFSGMVWDSTNYPNPARMARDLHADHFHLMATIWPAVGKGSKIFRDMQARGFLFPGAHWSPSLVYDTYNPAARDLYWRFAKRGLFDVGVDAWWMDATEPEFRSTGDRYVTALSIEANGRNALGSMARYLNPYSLVHTGGVYQHQRAASDEKRVFILTRSAFAGQQRNAAALWSGDIWSSWGVFRNQISAGLNTSMAGLPYWTTDIGGFISANRFPGGVADPAYRELYVRWFQFGAFCPLFRSHGTNTPREIWRFGEPGSWEYDALAAADALRYRLMPYIYSQAWSVTHDDETMMRALPLAFPDDHAGYAVDREFMFGPALLVSPITRPMKQLPAQIQEWIPVRNLFAADGVRHGMQLDFYRGVAFDSLVAQRRTEVFDLTWSGALPEQLVGTPYSVRYRGALRAEGAGRYELLLGTDRGVRLWIDDSLVVDQWDNRDTLTARASLTFAARSMHALRLEYRQDRTTAGKVTLEWITPEIRANMMLDSRWATYLPAGSSWFDFWTGEQHAGGGEVTKTATLEHLPLFVRAGSIVPLGPALQYASEKAADPIELRVYEGADGAFTLYEDEGDSYRYERGAFATIPIQWNHATRTLTIGARTGRFPGMLATRIFRVIWVREGHGTGASETSVADRTLRYDGRQVVVRR